MRESLVERYLCLQVRFALKGTAKKLKGINEPDRLVLLPGGHTHFVETKAPGKKPRPGQAREHARLFKLGFSVMVLDTKDAVDRFIEKRRDKSADR